MASRSYVLVDDREQAAEAIKELRASTMIGLDCEGVDLSRRGELCIVQIRRFLPPPAAGGNAVYLFDVVTLGSWLFDNGLRELLERQDVLKLMYDCRNDADALQHQYGVRLDGVRDLQLLGYIIRPSFNRLIMGLGKALTKYVVGYGGTQLKEDVKVVFVEDPAVWRKRPIRGRLLEYCANDVLYFLELYNYFDSQIFRGNKPSTMKRWAEASKNYVECKRALPHRLFSKYESNPLLPLRIIPEMRGDQVVEFACADTECGGCKRWFNRTEIRGSKCVVCNMVDAREEYS